MKTPLSIRWRLTIWYAATMSVILLIFGVLMYAMINQQLFDRIDAQLLEEADERVEEIRSVTTIDEIRALFERHDFERHNSDKNGFSFLISRMDGTVICGNEWLRTQSLPIPSSSKEAASDRLQNISLANHGLYRLLSRTVVRAHDPVMVRVLVPYSQIQNELRQASKMLYCAGFVALIIACAGGLTIASHALKPLDRITNAAERISAENLAVSIAVDNPADELGRLATTLNETFQRLRDAVDRMQRFTADAAHELRTPLSVLWTQFEVALRTRADEKQLCEYIQIGMEQLKDLIKLSDQLLTLSRHDAGVKMSLFEHVNLKVILDDILDVLGVEAASKGISLAVTDIPNCHVLGDDISLSRLFFNLIDNGIKYTPGGGFVNVTGVCDDRHVWLTVTDSGIGIPSAELSNVFERFYRVDASRNPRTGGSGLGLAICQSIVAAHGGAISVSNNFPSGTKFVVSLPLEHVPEVNRMATSVQRV